MKVSTYLRTRFTSLKPPLVLPENPFKLLRLLNRQQTAFFLVGFLAWTWDAFDFFTVTLNIVEISKTYQRTKREITMAITVTLMLRSVGAVIFGIAGDRFGRKWPFIINIIFYGIVEVATGFASNYGQFLALRAVFGIAMGGIYGNCAATALEDAPIATRGLLSGLLQQGYACGYLLAASFNLAITKNQRYGWRALFWFGGCPPLLIALWRVFLPETQGFLHVQKTREENDATKTKSKTSSMKAFIHTIRPALIQHWPLLIYMVLMMAGFNFLSHGSQDLYPTFLESSLHFTKTKVTITTVVSNFGAIIGGMTVGYFSSFFGRRLSILVVLIAGACLIPAYLLPKDERILAGAFFQQMCVQGVWGVVPIHLMELAPAQFRSFVVGTSYQLGNLISSASATIEAKAGEYFPTTNQNHSEGEEASFDYGKVMAIFLAFVYGYLFLVILFGPEKRNVDEVIEEEHQKEDEEVEAAQEVQLEDLSSSDSAQSVDIVKEL